MFLPLLVFSVGDMNSFLLHLYSCLFWRAQIDKANDVTLKQMLEFNLSIDNKLSRSWVVNFSIENKLSRLREMLSAENKLWNVNLSIESIRQVMMTEEIDVEKNVGI